MSEEKTIEPGDLLWYVPSGGQFTALASDSHVKVKEVHPDAGVALLDVPGGSAVVGLSDLRGYTTVRQVEDFGTVGRGPGAIERKHEVSRQIPVRCWRSKQHWEQHVATTRAWAKLLSRMQMHDQEDMTPFTVEDIEAAELALFGNVEP